MALMVFRNRNLSTRAENNFFDFLITEFKSAPFEMGIFCDVFVKGTQIDTMIVSEKGLLVLEYKNYSGALTGSENGRWEIETVNGERLEINQGREDVFQQLRRQRFSIMNFIGDNFESIFPNKQRETKQIAHINWILVFENLSEDSDIKLSHNAKMWLKIISKNEIKKFFEQLRPSGLTFTKDEILRIASALDLEQISTESVQIKSKQEQFCPVCAYITDPCAIPFITGSLISIENNNLNLKTESGLSKIQYNKQDKTEFTIIKLVSAFWKKYKIDNDVELNVFHLNKNSDGETEITNDSLIIISPAWLFSVTDFASLDFCERTAITNKFSFAPNNQHILRGNAINESLLDIVEAPENVSQAVAKAREFVTRNCVDYYTSGISAPELDETIEDEVKNLSEWATSQNFEDTPVTERFLLSTLLGLKGKIDLVFENDGRITDVIELKSSKPDFWKGGIREYHELQVAAYGMMVLLKQKEKFSEDKYPSVIYSKDSGNVQHKAAFTNEVFAKVCRYRNILLCTEIGLILPTVAPHPMQHANGCLKCSQNEICMDICRTVQFRFCYEHCWKHPFNTAISTSCKLDAGIDHRFRSHFDAWITFINKLKAYGHINYAKLLKTDRSEKIENGKMLEIDSPRLIGDSGNGGFVYAVKFNTKNLSEFRKYDIILLSDDANVSESNVALGMIKNISYQNGEIEVRQKLTFSPQYVLPYYPDRFENLNFLGLYLAFFKKTEFYSLIYDDEEAFKKAIEALDIELIHGPPGSGKTAEIVNLIENLVDDGKKVFITALTNKAIENIHRRLIDEKGLGNKILRIGNSSRIEDYFPESTIKMDYHNKPLLKMAIESKQIVISTIHSSSSESLEKITELDYVILDEASQINIPMSFLAISRAKKVVLVGDHNQLPPIFPKDIEGDEKFFTQSLFEFLWKKLKRLNPTRCRFLSTQYRMNNEIAAYPAKVWYKGLETAEKDKDDRKVKDGRLDIPDGNWMSDKFKIILNPEHPSLWIQVKSEGEFGISKRSNIKEAQICASIAYKFIRYGVEPKQIGIIAPFRKQVNEIRNRVEAIIEGKAENSGDILENLVVDTIDRFQGSEKNIIIISMCDGDSKNNFLISDLRRFNVAITRAKVKRIIVGDMELYSEPIITGIIHDGYTKLIKAM